MTNEQRQEINRQIQQLSLQVQNCVTCVNLRRQIAHLQAMLPPVEPEIVEQRNQPPG